MTPGNGTGVRSVTADARPRRDAGRSPTPPPRRSEEANQHHPDRWPRSCGVHDLQDQVLQGSWWLDALGHPHTYPLVTLLIVVAPARLPPGHPSEVSPFSRSRLSWSDPGASGHVAPSESRGLGAGKERRRNIARDDERASFGTPPDGTSGQLQASPRIHRSTSAPNRNGRHRAPWTPSNPNATRCTRRWCAGMRTLRWRRAPVLRGRPKVAPPLRPHDRSKWNRSSRWLQPGIQRVTVYGSTAS